MFDGLWLFVPLFLRVCVLTRFCWRKRKLTPSKMGPLIFKDLSEFCFLNVPSSFIYFECISSGWCEPPPQLLLSFSRHLVGKMVKMAHLFLICSSRYAQPSHVFRLYFMYPP